MDLPSCKKVIFHSYVNVYQRVFVTVVRIGWFNAGISVMHTWYLKTGKTTQDQQSASINEHKVGSKNDQAITILNYTILYLFHVISSSSKPTEPTWVGFFWLPQYGSVHNPTRWFSKPLFEQWLRWRPVDDILHRWLYKLLIALASFCVRGHSYPGSICRILGTIYRILGTIYRISETIYRIPEVIY